MQEGIYMQTEKELQATIDKLQPIYDKVKEKLVKVAENEQNKIRRLFASISDRPVTVRVSLYGSGYVTVTLLDDDGKPAFGAGIDIHYWPGAKVELNVGCCGAFDDTNILQIKKHEMVVNFFKHYNKYSDAIICAVEALKPYEEDEFEARQALNEAQRALNEYQEAQADAKILENLKEGNVYNINKFIREDFRYHSALKVIKMTNKIIKVGVGNIDTTDKPRVIYYSTKNLKKDNLVAMIKDQSLTFAFAE